jgi:hypothetical protein
MKLVDDAKRAWRWISMQAMSAALALSGAWLAIPDDMKASIPPKYVAAATMALLALGIVGRLVDQGEKK